MNDIDEDDCTATEKLWVSYEAYHNRESEESNTFVISIAVFRALKHCYYYVNIIFIYYLILKSMITGSDP